MLGSYHTEALLNAISDLHFLHERAQVYAFSVNRVSEVVKAEMGIFFSVDLEKEELIPEASKGVALSLLKEIPFKLKNGICGWVAAQRQTVNIPDAYSDKRFYRAVDVLTGIRTRAVLCAPIVYQEKLLGVLELINRQDGVFREADAEFLERFALQVAVCLDNIQLVEREDRLVSFLRSVINSLSSGFISCDANGVVTACNQTACRILGLSESDVVGKSALKAFPDFPAFSAILEVTRKNEVAVQRQEIELPQNDRPPLLIGYSTFLIRDKQRALLGFGMIFQDITKYKKA